MGGTVVHNWEKYRDGIMAIMKEYSFPRIAYDTEYLYGRLKDYEREHPEMGFVSPRARLRFKIFRQLTTW